MKKNTIVELVSYAFALLFLYTGIIKLIDQRLFRLALIKSPLLHQFAQTLALIVPIGEVLVAIALMLPRFQRRGLYCSLVLMFFFTTYVGYMIFFRRTELPCSCGGIIQQMTWRQHFYFNAIFTLLAAIALWLQKRIQQQAENNHTLVYN